MSTSTSASIRDQLRTAFAELEDGFQRTNVLEGADATAASALLKRLTNKMAESKRLIKEFEKVALKEGKLDAEALAKEKKDLVSSLNKFVQMKKRAQEVIVEKQAERKSAATEAGSSDAGASTSAYSAGPAPSATAFTLPAFKAKKKDELLEDQQLQQMEAGDLIQHGRNILDETDKSIMRSEAVVEETIQIGTQTAEALRGQTQQLERIVDDLDEIHFSLKKSFGVLKDITRGLATDKCILFLLFLVVSGVLTVIILKATGK